MVTLTAQGAAARQAGRRLAASLRRQRQSGATRALSMNRMTGFELYLPSITWRRCRLNCPSMFAHRRLFRGRGRAV